MADNIKGIPFSSDDEGFNFVTMARDLVFKEALALGVRNDHQTFSRDEVYVVWFCFILGNFKALCATSLPDGRYYEVTYNREKKVAFVDTYIKTHNNEFAIIL